MTLIRLIHRASILAGMTIATIPFSHNPALSDTPEFCVVANNGKTACGTLKAVERACVTTDAGSTVCGKFKSVRGEQTQEPKQEEARNPTPSAGYRKDMDGITYLLRSCRRAESSVKCNFLITTKKEGKQFYVVTGGGRSSMVDVNGKTYPSSEYLDYNGGSASISIRVDMSVGVDYVVDINFEKIPEQITKAALLNIGANYKIVQFKNIPISN